MPLEELWRAFFTGHKGKYSLYVHPHNAHHVYSPASIFFGRKIPSRPLRRFTISEPAAVRRALAYALLDTAAPNIWFTIQSETSIPVRPFPFTYNYLRGSNLSFVEAFYPWDWWRKQWRDKPQVRDNVQGDFGHNQSRSKYFPGPTGCMLIAFRFPLLLLRYTPKFPSWMVGNFS